MYTTCVGDWIINSCSNCEADVFITHAIKGDKTFVFAGVLVSKLKLSCNSNLGSSVISMRI